MSDKLTAKQEAFVLAYLETGNGVEAYKRAYNADGMSYASVDKEARRLLGHPRITPRLSRLAQKAEVRALLSLEEHMSELSVLRDLAKQEKQISAAIAAEVKRGELRKFYVKQIESGGPGDFDNMSADDLRDFIAGRIAPVGESQEGAAAPRRRGTAGSKPN